MGPVGRELGLEHLSREGFLRLVDFVLEQIPPARVHAGRRMPPPPSGVSVELYAYPVFDVPLTGGKHLRCGDGDGVAELELRPGEVLFSEPFAWKLPLWDRPHELCCLVFRPECIRITYVDAGSGGRPVCGCFFHTALPPSDTVRKVAGCLAAAPDEARCDLVRALFRMSRAALAEDQAEPPGKARITYEKIRLHLEENFGVETDRARVARLFGLNPGYLSRLFAEHGERGFSETLLEIRMAYAAMLLRETELLVDEVAFRCGYRSTTFFSAVFRNCHGMPPGRFRRRFR
ncbi:MAG TPA: hypothetical protein DFL85_18040 [Lentisphaeria bacterium]|uniref:helix-turn-helix transcriptional regulator n=1 Tax=Victivallis lenta TaxID=2606640 RepID=UPI000E7D5895|nr:helix-turn-helix transcriptional regulator [Victivallis lenta]HBP08132.1 hypothetical protein [Lentisphaeria bacterium]HCH87395.1 hypothetical protein [Lentisphaeria bacterium]